MRRNTSIGDDLKENAIVVDDKEYTFDEDEQEWVSGDEVLTDDEMQDLLKRVLARANLWTKSPLYENSSRKNLPRGRQCAAALSFYAGGTNMKHPLKKAAAFLLAAALLVQGCP